MPRGAKDSSSKWQATIQIIEEYVEGCPFRLYDIHERCFITRDKFLRELKARLTRHHIDQLGSGALNVSNIPDDLLSAVAYATLSHRWCEDEILFEDLKEGRVDDIKHDKFIKFCQIAESYGCRYVWIDTACINKCDITELDASIRSMFYWYKHASVCIAYLGSTANEVEMKADPWFTRGWTLQELLAPKRVAFFLRDWSRLDPKTRFDIVRGDSKDMDNLGDDDYNRDQSGCELRTQIAKSASVGEEDLVHYQPKHENVETLIDWVNRRATRDPEDLAYCLVGLLNLHFPTAYGEGRDQALRRLKDACVKSAERLARHKLGTSHAIDRVVRDKSLLCEKHRCRDDLPVIIHLNWPLVVSQPVKGITNTLLLSTATPWEDKFLRERCMVIHDEGQFTLFAIQRFMERLYIPSGVEYCQACCPTDRDPGLIKFATPRFKRS